MDGGSNIPHQSMTQLLESCTSLANALNTTSVVNSFSLSPNSSAMDSALLPRKIHGNGGINDENVGPPSMGGSQVSDQKVDFTDLAQLAALRRPRGPTMSRRNERERNRVRYLNFTFDVLRQHLPRKGSKGKAKKMSKVDTLRGAIDYIRGLQDLLGENGSPGVAAAAAAVAAGASFPGTESEAESLSPAASPSYSESPDGTSEQLSDGDDELIGNLSSWFC